MRAVTPDNNLLQLTVRSDQKRALLVRLAAADGIPITIRGHVAELALGDACRLSERLTDLLDAAGRDDERPLRLLDSLLDAVDRYDKRRLVGLLDSVAAGTDHLARLLARMPVPEESRQALRLAQQHLEHLIQTLTPTA